MKPTLSALLLIASLGLPGLRAEGTQGPRVTLSVKEGDLRDILRAAAHGTDFNLAFEPGLETSVRGIELKGVTLEEILEAILPGQGLGYTRQGRTIHIHRGNGGLRFYQVDLLSLRRSGTKHFQVNASGQVIQSTGGAGGGGASGGAAGSGAGSGGAGQGGQGGQSGNSSAYASSVQAGNAFDPWEEIEMGLSTLVFGKPAQLRGGDGGTAGPGAPSSRGMAKEGRSVVIHPESGLVVVDADASTHRRVEAYLGQLKRRNGRQIILEARIVEVTLGVDSQVGVDWNSVLHPGGASGNTGTDIKGSFTQGATLNPNVQAGDGLARLVVQNARVVAALNALAREGRLNVLSAPRISTLNNQKAILRVVREEAYFLQNSQVTPSGGVGGAIATVQISPVVVPVGIVLDIQPQVGDDGLITLAVNPSVSEIVTVRNFTVVGQNGATGASATLPVVDRRDLDAVVKVRSGETLVLAGIIKAKEGTEDRGVPWVRKIPFVGGLFSKREKTKAHTELAIFITPTLVEDPDQVEAQRLETERRLDQAGAQLQPAPQKGRTRRDP